MNIGEELGVEVVVPLPDVIEQPKEEPTRALVVPEKELVPVEP